MTDEPDILSDLNLVVGPSPPLAAVYERDLGPEDLEAKANAPSLGPSTLKRIHSSHHALAKLIAIGTKNRDAALITGYNPVRISALQRDPLFMRLVEDYRLETKETVADMTARMVNFSIDALEKLHERLLESPEDFSVGALVDAIKAFADRTGYGPGTKLEVSMARDTIDRPPRETHEEWLARRNRELGSDQDTLEPPTGTSKRSH